MKITLLTLLIAFTSHTFAGCADDFTNGLNEYNFAARYFAQGSSSYNRAVELSRTTNPNFDTVCNHLVDSVAGFSVATNSYAACSSDFSRAVSSCGGNDSVQAVQNREVCLGNQNIANDNQITIRLLLKNTCYLKTNSLEKIELEEINYFID